MSEVYLLDETYATVGRLDSSFSKLEVTERYQDVDVFTMEIERTQLYADQIAPKRFIYLPGEDNSIFIIETITQAKEEPNNTLTVQGSSVEAFALLQRRVIPDAGQAYDSQHVVPAETAIKHYVNKHAGALAAAARQLPDFVVAADAAQGANVSIDARFQFLLPVLQEIGRVAGMGWRTYLIPGPPRKTGFDVVIGTDRHTSVFFDFSFQTLKSWERMVDIKNSKTVAIVAGQGEAEDRDVVTVWQGAEPTGFNRREDFVDARDVPLGSTAILNQRGNAFLNGTAPETRLEARTHQYGSFQYRVHWWLGDQVLIRDAAEGISYTARVIAVTTTWGEDSILPERVAVLDKPMPDLKEAMKVSAASASPIVDAFSSSPGVTDHGALTGLGDDDHPQYATNAEFDSHHARHATGGADPLAPSDIGAATSVHVHTHASTTGQTVNDHHSQAHGHTGADSSGTVAHANTTGKTANDHHNQAHALSGADHTGTLGGSQVAPFYNYAMKATLTGGGYMQWNGASFKWNVRFILISQGGGANAAANGYFDIHCPTSGTVIGVNRANATADANGIPMSAWDALYWVMPQGGAYNSADTAADFRLVSYASGLTGDIPYNWILIALRNDDNQASGTGAEGITGGFLWTTANGGGYLQPIWGSDASYIGGANWPLRVHWSSTHHDSRYSLTSHNHSGVYAAASHSHSNPIAIMDTWNGTSMYVTGEFYNWNNTDYGRMMNKWSQPRGNASVACAASASAEVTVNFNYVYGDANTFVSIAVVEGSSTKPPMYKVKSVAAGSCVFRVFNNAAGTETYRCDIIGRRGDF